jgi:hypothetical protein
MSNILIGLLDRKQHAKELDLCGGNQSGNEIDLRRRESVSHGAEETSQHVDTNENWEGWRTREVSEKGILVVLRPKKDGNRSSQHSNNQQPAANHDRLQIRSCKMITWYQWY